MASIAARLARFARGLSTEAAMSTGVSVNGAYAGVSIQNNGSGQAHPNAQPTIVFNKIIFAGD